MVCSVRSNYQWMLLRGPSGRSMSRMEKERSLYSVESKWCTGLIEQGKYFFLQKDVKTDQQHSRFWTEYFGETIRWGRRRVSLKYSVQKCECCSSVLISFWCLLPTRIKFHSWYFFLFLKDFIFVWYLLFCFVNDICKCHYRIHGPHNSLFIFVHLLSYI